ncbi:MAG: ABC-type dipeptide transport system, periplasmic component [Bacteroidetes bacterium]|nr:ABC-type dipeptide transport system, periplasmic component [Bacteroidota bacterium]
MRKYWLLLTIPVLIIISSCTNEAKEKDTRTVFSYNEMAGITSLDPANAISFENKWPVNQLVNGLVQMDDELNVIPSIAHKYSVSEDGLVYTFNLRTDVYFHDSPCFDKGGKGRKVVAKDFVFSFDRLFDGSISSATSLLTNIDRSEKSAYKGFEAVDDSTLKIYLKEPFSAFLSILTMQFFSVIPHEAIDFYKTDFRRNPVGTGPFTFKLWEDGTKLILVKNENYFEKDAQGKKLPYLDAITVSFVRERETAFMELLNGKFDMLSGADAFNTNEVLDRDGNLTETYAKKFYLQKQTFLKTDYIGFLIDENIPAVKNSPVRLKAIRKAINYGFDREKMIKHLRSNIGEPAQAGFIPKGMKSYDPEKVKGYTYDPNKVKELLAEAGFPEGKGLPEITMHITDNYKEQVQFIQSQLALNKIKVQINIEKPSVLRQAVNSCEYLLFKKSWVGDYADEENFMSLFYSKNFSPQGVNYFHYKNPEFDLAYEKAQRETSDSVKIKLYQKMDQMVIDDAPVIPLFYDQVIRLVHHHVKGMKTNPMNLLNLKTVTKEKNAQ